MVNPQDASYVELMALNAYFVDIGELDANDLGAFERPAGDDLEKADYLNALRKWRDTQFTVGNMVGYQKVANVCDALINLQQEQNGTVHYIEAPNGMGTVRTFAKEGNLHCGVLGMSSFGEGDDFHTLSAFYASESTDTDPIVEVHVDGENGETNIFKVHINDIDPKNATQLEMFALCAHADAQGISGTDRSGITYMILCEYAGAGGYEAGNMADFTGKKQNWSEIVHEAATTVTDGSWNIDNQWTQLLEKLMEAFVENLSDEVTGNGELFDMSEENPTKGSSLLDHISGKKEAPYSSLARNGIIEYNGVVFVCDYEHNILGLGDTSNPNDCINIPLSGGGCLLVNRDNLGDLASAIGMFSPEDINRIMRAIALDTKVQQELNEIEEDKNKIGDGNTNVLSEDETATEKKAETMPDGKQYEQITEEQTTLEDTEQIFESDLITYYKGDEKREDALTDKRYTDETTGRSWHVSEDGTPYTLA